MRFVALVVVVVLLIVGIGYGAFQFLLVAPEAPQPPPHPLPVVEEPVAVPEVSVVATRGAVEVQRYDGAWSAAQVGEQLAHDEAVRTGRDGAADLEIGSGAKITMGESAELEVGGGSATVQSLKLRRGRIGVDYKKRGDRLLRIENENGDAVAETRDAKFSVMNTGLAFVVATETGGVNLEAAGESVAVGEGQQSVVRAGAKPTVAKPIPVSLLLKVAVPRQRGLAGVCANVHGKTDPGANVTIDGEQIVVAADGSFNVNVPRRRGKSSTHVVTIDATGRTSEKTIACRVEPRPVEDPRIEGIGIQWGSGEKKGERDSQQ